MIQFKFLIVYFYGTEYEDADCFHLYVQANSYAKAKEQAIAHVKGMYGETYTVIAIAR